jgi:alpha-mannosidase
MPPGTPWGAKWEYGWFQAEVKLPAQAEDRRVVIRLEPGGEAIVWIDGQIAGAHDAQHREITLSSRGVPGTVYQLLAETYAGHGPRVVHAGPTPPGRETVPEPGPMQTVVGRSSFGVWEEDVYQLWVDVETLHQIRELLHEDSLRVAEIDCGLRDFTTIVDFELAREEMLVTVRACRDRLRPLLSCANGSTSPVMFAFGHAHIDVAWLWPLQETERKCARTFGTQLALLNEYPDYLFLQSQPHLYEMVKRRYPALYERIKEAVTGGRFIVEGATWVEPDTNVTGGESLIRQFLHGKRFFQDEFGFDCKLLWLPDVFGYSAALPQIMRGCGVPYFSTQKIFWAYHGGDPFPYNTFTWEGIDGSEVRVHLHNDYNARIDPQSLIFRWRERVQKDGIATRLYPFGYGDGGGGPTRNHLECARREHDLEGVPRVRLASPLEYFRDQEARGWPKARYVGELYFQCHRGTLTSQARTKKGNRDCELALRDAEMWGVAARALRDARYPTEELDKAWKTILLNQFHDILPGSSIARVYTEAEAAYAEVLHTATEAARAAAAALTDDSHALTVFNTLSWDRRSLVALPPGYDGAALPTGEVLPVQRADDRTLVEVDVPACGWTSLVPAAAQFPDNALSASSHRLENDLLRVDFNALGEITSILDLETGEELAAGPCNRFSMFKDVPSAFDAWDIDSMYEQCPVDLREPASLEVVSTGPLLASVRITRQLHHSTLAQEVSLRRGSRRIDFQTMIDWQERHKLLKVAFPVAVHANEAIHEIQFGHIRRPNHRSRPFDADRFEVCNHKWTALAEEARGCAVLNDCKYGVSVLANTISLTLLKSALAPDMHADQGVHEFAYAFFNWTGALADSGVVREGYDLNCAVGTALGSAGRRSLFSVSSPNVIVETVKPAQDDSGDVVVRLYESMRTATRCAVRSSLDVGSAWQADMLEAFETELAWRDGAAELSFRPFEVKTVRLRLK